jgi:ABC-type sugar transport system permease subunit
MKAWEKVKDVGYDVSCWLHNLKKKNEKNNKPVGFSTKKRSQSIFVFGMLLIPVIHFLVFWVYVNFSSILFAFQKTTPTGIIYTLENFEYAIKEIFREGSTIASALKNTLTTWVLDNVIMFALSILWSWFIYKRIKGGSIFRVIFYIPVIVSGAAVTTIFTFMLQAKGPVGQLYQLLFETKEVPSFLLDERYAMKTVLVYIFLTGFGGNMVLLSGAMSRIPKEMMESAIMDGCGMWREIFHFVIPLCWSTLSTMLIISLAALFTASGPILLLTGGSGNTFTLSYWIFYQVKFLGKYNQPAALGLIFTLVGLPIVLFVRWFFGKFYTDLEY